MSELGNQSDLTHQSALSLLQEAQRHLDAATGRNALAELEKHQKLLAAAVRHNPIDELKTTLANFDEQQRALAAAVQHNPIAHFDEFKATLAHLDEQQRALAAAVQHDPIAHFGEFKATLAHLDEQQKALAAAVRHNPIAQFERNMRALDPALKPDLYLESTTDRRALPPVSYHKPDENRLSSVSDLGYIVRQKRKDMGLTQQQFADLTGVGRRFVSELEAGKPTLEFGRILKVCQAIGIDLVVAQR